MAERARVIVSVRNRIHAMLTTRGEPEIQFARRIQMDQGHLNRIKNGRALPTLKTALVIAGGLGVPVDEVFYVEATPRA